MPVGNGVSGAKERAALDSCSDDTLYYFGYETFGLKRFSRKKGFKWLLPPDR